MANLIWMILRSPLRSLGVLYTFTTLALISVARRILLPHLPVYQSLRLQFFRSYLIATGAHYPELVYRLPIQASASRAKPIETSDFKAYLVPSNGELSSVMASDGVKQRCVVLLAHGGGYVSGEALMYLHYIERWIQKASNRNLDLVFLTVEYPLSSTASHPAQVNSFVAAYRYLLDLGIPSSQIVFMGDSAGAGLNLIAGSQIAELSLPQPAGYVLLSPWIDHSGEPFEGGNPAVETDYIVKANTAIPEYSRIFIGNLAGTSPEINPLYLENEKVKAFSRQLILVGGADFALNEDRHWAAKLKKAGVEHKLVREWGQVHRYALGSRWLPKAVREKTDNLILEWISQCLT